MMENKILKLKFRVIALVSSDNGAGERVRNLFKQFKDAQIKGYLNNHSLNQAGYEVEIENEEMFDAIETAELDDYFYAFSRTEWTNKHYFSIVNKEKYKLTADGYGIRAENGELVKESVPTETIIYDGDIDNIVFKEYQKKLESKNKTYSGGVIILCDYESPNDYIAFSRTKPLDHYKIFVYSNGLADKDTYAHEIGHMLGLPHTFFDEKEKEAYRQAKENIIGNGEPEYNLDGSSNEKHIKGINNIIQIINQSTDKIQAYNYITAIKEDISKALENLISHQKLSIKKEKNDIDIVTIKYKKFPDSYKINKTQTKGEYIKISNNNIKHAQDNISRNEQARKKLLTKGNHRFITLDTEAVFLKPHLLELLQQNKKYYENIISQIHYNYLMFVKETTQNIMDYDNKKILFSHNQIKIMRSDIQNYMDIPCKFCKKEPNKKR